VIGGPVKSFPRFQQLLGKCGPEMAPAIPRIPEYGLGRLPMVLSDAHVERVLSSFRTGTIAGRRDFADVLLRVQSHPAARIDALLPDRWRRLDTS